MCYLLKQVLYYFTLYFFYSSTKPRREKFKIIFSTETNTINNYFIVYKGSVFRVERE